VVALIVQKQNEAQGNVNPVLYALAGNASTYAAAFHDITTGNNMVPCEMSTKDCPASPPLMIGYSAGTGYDVASGWGSVDVSALASAWNGPSNPDFALSASSSSLTIGSGGMGTDTITVTALAGFSGTVNLSCSVAGLNTTTCSLSPASVAGSGTSTLTINAATLTSRLDRSPSFSPRGLGMECSFLFAAVLLVPRRSRSWTACKKKSLSSSGVLAVLVITMMLTMASCGGSSSAAPPPPPTPLNGTVTVTGSSGTLTHSVQIAVTID
jgi:hypothetical protein